MKLVGASSVARVSGLDELPGKSNYFIGNDPNKWRTNVPTYARVKYQAIYPGVDLVFYGNQRQLEHDFVVAPGADPSTVAFRLQGSKEVSLDAGGNLVIAVDGGEVRFERPLIYQETNGARREIPGGYVLKGAREVAFKVGAYDPTRPLVIDPVLVYSTYLSLSEANNLENGGGIAADSSGNAYVVGYTGSANFPGTVGAYQTSPPGNYDTFVTKLNPSGSALVYSTYLGGSNKDEGLGVAVDSSGDAYVTGNTNSSDFPTTAGAFQTSLAGIWDAFVTKLNPSGSALAYSTYLGGGSSDFGDSIAVDSSGHAYVTGYATSSNFPTTAGAFQTSLAGIWDTFVTKLDPSGSALVYSTYLGGSNYDTPYGIAVDSSGDAYVTGNTNSSDFPTTAGAFQTSLAGIYSAFVTKLDPSGSALVYSTYLGGSNYDIGGGVAVDGSGNAYVTGGTGSTDFPTASPLQGALRGTVNAFVTELNPTGSAPVYSTYLGGSGSDYGVRIAIDSGRNAYVAGSTTSPDFNGVSSGSIQPAYGGGEADMFLAVVQAGGSSLLYATYLGGSGADYGRAIALDPLGNAYITGSTGAGPATPGAASGSFVFPTTPGAWQPGPQFVNCAVYPAGYIPFTQITSAAFGSFSGGISSGYLVVGYTTPAAFSALSNIPVSYSLYGEAFCVYAELAPNQSYSAWVPTAAMRSGDFSSFSGQIINPLTGQPFAGNIIPPALLGTVFAWPVGAPVYSEAFVAKIAITPAGQVSSLQNTVEALVSAGTLSANFGQFLLAPLNEALAALGSGPATGTVAAIDPGQATGRAAFDHGPATLAPAALVHRHTAAAIRDLNEFIGRVRLLVLFRRLKPAEGRILIALANGIITALRV
jgi:hypothetical protein